ncbi:hypothetical protein DL93DRAFT_2090982 [Clavulina sp. PMI_390]|nr:hypothetical protein DL93DRAFT_2090982 [Clavulina sp. PMI_390]
MPMLAVMVTLGSFAFFVYHVLMQVAPDVVLPIFIITGIVVGLNFFVFIFFFVKWVGVRMWRGVKWVGALVGLGRRPTDVLPVAPEVVEVKVSGDPPIRMPVPIVEVSQYRPAEKA